ncbi:MAG: hypothetical protein EOO11_09710 [Chitinophagaceae bacterium]|nr:MAG: hypothetical protein EOO11_09710 [Chitinophagaceae bacterium]
MRKISLLLALFAALNGAAQAPASLELHGFQRSSAGAAPAGTKASATVQYFIYVSTGAKVPVLVTRLWIHGQPYAFSFDKVAAPVTLDVRTAPAARTDTLVRPGPYAVWALTVGRSLRASGFPSARPEAIRIEYQYNGIRYSKTLKEFRVLE